MSSKVDKKEGGASAPRLDDIEDVVNKSVESTVRAKFSHLELTLKRNVEAKLDNIKSEIADKIEDITRLAGMQSQGWKLPLSIVVIVFTAALAGMYQKIKRSLDFKLL